MLDQFLWRFKCAGVFSGISSFSGDDETKYFLKIDFYGGKATVEVSEKDFDFFSKKKIGLGLRIGGPLLLNGGNVKPVIETIGIEGQKDFKTIDMTDLMEGMTFEGVGTLDRKRSAVRNDGSSWYGVSVKTLGGLIGGIPVSEEAFETLPVGQCRLSGTVTTEISSVFADGKRQQSVRNSLLIVGAKKC